MSVSKFTALAACSFMLASGSASAAATPPDAIFSTSYMPGDGYAISWSTCGATSTNVGCTGGTIEPLNGACAIMQGAATIDGGKVVRDVYVVEASSTAYPNAVLDVYRHAVFAGGKNITATMKFLRRFDLGLKVGLRSSCYMSANAQTVYIGTNSSGFVAIFDKASSTLKHFPNGKPMGSNVSSMFADNAGYVIVNFGRGTSFWTFVPPGGTGGGEGGGSEYNLNDTNAIGLQ